MKTLSQKLTELYAPLSPNLRMELQARGMKTKNEFVLSMALRPDCEDPDSPELEKWYSEADVKVMVFGQEAYNWGEMVNEDPQYPDYYKTAFQDVQREYEEFYLNYYNPQEGYFDEDKIKSRFFKFATNGIRSIFYDKIFVPPYEGKRAAFVWNNISKLSNEKGGPVSSEVHAIERELFHVIPGEIEILKPDIVIFFTGPGHNTYYQYILENFKQTAPSEALGNVSMHDVEKMHLEGVKLAYKTYHPNQRKEGITDEVLWDFYHAIEDDIKNNIEKILQ